ncbi:MAG: VWA domain-containing protein, partial [Chrysiogenetes bacterium]|nr:VWA domain-containing protein [Chrysiogenetes bacterium]
GSASFPLLEAGWQSRQVAAEFLERTAARAAALGPDGLGVLAESAAQIGRRHAPIAMSWLDEGPGLLEGLPAHARDAMIGLLLAAARGIAPAFAEIARRAVAVTEIMAEDASVVLEVAASLHGEAAEEVLDFLRDTPRLLSQKYPPHLDPWIEGHKTCLQAARALTKENPKAAKALLQAIPELRRLARPEELPRWIEEGTRSSKDDPGKAQAWFALSSKASRAQLHAYAEGLPFAEVARSLSLFAHGLIGERIDIGVLTHEDQVALQHYADRPLPTTDGRKIFLPELIWGYGSREANRRAARMATAHQAGHFEFGTFEFSTERLAKKRSALMELSRYLPDEDQGTSLAAFFSKFPMQLLARDLFTIFEGYRVDMQLRHRYAGLVAEVDWLWGVELARRPALLDALGRGGPLSLLCELLIRRTLGEDTLPEELRYEEADGGWNVSEEARAWNYVQLDLAQLWDDVGAFTQSLKRDGATVEDAALRTAELYHLSSLFMGTGVGEGSRLLSELLAEEPDADAVRASKEGTGEISQEIADAYDGTEPILHRGEVDPAQVQETMGDEQTIESIERAESAFNDMTPEEFAAFLEAHPEIVEAFGPEDPAGAVLTGFLPSDAPKEKENTDPLEERRNAALEAGKALEDLKRRLQRKLGIDQNAGREETFIYDEWDHTIGDYRASWCTVHEQPGREEDPATMETVLAESAQIIRGVIRQFERIRPEQLRIERNQPDGEEIDLNAVIEAKADRRTGQPWPDRLYTRRVKVDRDVATLLLVDMSASTGERVVDYEKQASQQRPDDAPEPDDHGDVDPRVWWDRDLETSARAPALGADRERTVLDIEREAVLVMSKALEYLGDNYAIYGFSGHGRDNVDLYRIKDFEDTQEHKVLRRIAGIRPRQSTRMGAAIRHALWRLSHTEARYKSLVLISDGYPQDTDYGNDRRDETYGLLDTRAALTEAERAGVHPFCVTVDRAGYDYLRKMSPHESYLVIDHVMDLPRVLPRVYRKITR